MKKRTPQPSLLERLKRNTLLYHLCLIAVILFSLGITAHVVMQVGTRHSARRTVPDFSGIRLHDAERLATKHDLKLHINDSLFVPAYEGGIVLDQLPESGVEVKPGRTVYITINSFRQKIVPVPFVAGRSLRQAKNMLEIAGLEIAELVYQPDIATNYVLEELFEERPIQADGEVEAEMGSGITLHVGVEESKNHTAIPQIIGLSLREAKGRVWESGLNIGRVIYDEGINLLNQKDARVYRQSLAAEQVVTLGTKVDLRLTLDRELVARERAAAEKAALDAAKLRAEEEQRVADSLAQAELEQRLSKTLDRAIEQNAAATTDDFFE
ncbi:MAG: PASTA domain-containing protein [Alistipes sp.]|nr:PASTA domain-containing protein [Alistipes sp.]